MSPTDGRYAVVTRALLARRGVSVKEGRGFGAGALTRHGRIFAMRSSRGEFVVKLPRTRVDELVAAGRGRRFDPGRGRVMKEWFAVAPRARIDWVALANEARRFVAAERSEDDLDPE